MRGIEKKSERQSAPIACHFSTGHRWTDERIFHKQCKSLAAEGWDVRWIVPATDAVNSDGVKIVMAPKPASKMGRFTTTAAHVIQLALRQKADVYQFHDPELLIPALVLKLFGKTVIYDTHENYEDKTKSRHGNNFYGRCLGKAWWWIEKSAAACLDQVIAADSVTKAKFPPGKAECIANFPPRSFTDVVRTRAHGPFRILYVGTMSWDRGLLQMAEAMDHLQDLDVEFHIIGASGDEALTDRITAHKRVIIRGRVPWQELNAEVVQYDLGIALFQPLPAYMYYPGENIVKLWEYMAVGVPVLISDFPMLRALITKLGCGVAADPASPKALADAIRKLYHDPQARQKMSEAGRSAIRERYNWEHERGTLLQIYDRLLKQRLG